MTTMPGFNPEASTICLSPPCQQGDDIFSPALQQAANNRPANASRPLRPDQPPDHGTPRVSGAKSAGREGLGHSFLRGVDKTLLQDSDFCEHVQTPDSETQYSPGTFHRLEP